MLVAVDEDDPVLEPLVLLVLVALVDALEVPVVLPFFVDPVADEEPEDEPVVLLAVDAEVAMLEAAVVDEAAAVEAAAVEEAAAVDAALEADADAVATVFDKRSNCGVKFTWLGSLSALISMVYEFPSGVFAGGV